MPCWFGSGSLVRGVLRRYRSYASGVLRTRRRLPSRCRPTHRGAGTDRCAGAARSGRAGRSGRSRRARRGVAPDARGSPSVSMTSRVTRSWSPSFWKWPVRTSATRSSRPAVCGSTSPFVVFLRRGERPDRERRDVGERRGDLVRQRQPQVVDRGSPPRFWKGSTARVDLAAGGGRGRLRGARASRPASAGPRRGRRRRRPRIFRAARAGGGGGGRAAAVFPLARRLRVALQALQVRLQLGRALVAQVPVLLEGGVDDALQLRGQLRVELDRRRPARD